MKRTLILLAAALASGPVLAQQTIAVPSVVAKTAITYDDGTGKSVNVSAANPLPVTGGGGGGGGSTGVAQGSTSAGQAGTLIQGAARATAPTYTTATTNPLSLDLAGNLRTTIANTAFGISGTLPAFAATPTVNIGTAPSIAVTGTFWQATQPVSAASLPLPTGAATAAGLTTINTTLGTPYQAGGALPLPAGAATSANQASELTKLDTLHADLIAPTPAGELHIGEVGGNQTTVTVAQTVTASSAYASGNAVGGLMTFAGVARVSATIGSPGTSGLIQSVVVASKSAQTGAVDVVFFNANPTASTCTDKTAFAVAAADFDKIVGVAHVTDWTSLGTPSAGQSLNLAMPYALASSTSLYACAVTRSTPTFASTSDISVIIRPIRN